MLRSIYSSLMALAQPGIVWQLRRRLRQYPHHRARMKEHWGHYDRNLFQNSIWIHAASMGEVAIAKTLITRLQEHHAHLCFTLTTNTPTGADAAQALVSKQIQHVFAPIDRPAVLRRFFKTIRPRALILIEKELWPNALHFCQQQSIPVSLINGVVSPRSFKRLKQFPQLAKALLGNLDVIAAQSEMDKRKYCELGVIPDRVHVTGNIKFDMTVPMLPPEQLDKLKAILGHERTVLIGGSTHHGEDSALLAAYRLLKPRFPELLLILVPRHPERFDTVAQLCETNRFNVVRRSEAGVCDAKTDVFLGDTMGELMAWYQCANLAFVGGSLAAKGGHNPLEPIACHIPTLIGPHTFNCQGIIDDLKKAGAIQIVDDETMLSDRLNTLLKQPEKQQMMIEAGKQVLNAGVGACARTLACLPESILRKQTCCG